MTEIIEKAKLKGKLTGIYLDMDVWVRTKKEADKQGRSFSNQVNNMLKESPVVKFKRVNTERMAQEIFNIFQDETPEVETLKKMIDERLGL